MANTAKLEPRATSLDVARRAGVHQSTVSRAMTPGGHVAPATRERVLAASRELGYVPDALARGLTTRRSALVGILIGGLSSPFQPYVLERLVHRLTLDGFRPLVFSAPAGQEIDDLLPAALEYRPDALVVASARLGSAGIDWCLQQGTRVVLFNRLVPGAAASSVACDNVAGGRLAAEHLAETGARRIAILTGSADSSTARDREAGFAALLAERAIAPAGRESAAYTYDAGHAAALRMLRRRQPPDALFCASDILALGACDSARVLGLRIPDDLAIVGFDDIPMASWAPYDLTTVRQPVDAMIDAAAELVRGAPAEPVSRLFPGELVVRGSSRSAGEPRP